MSETKTLKGEAAKTIDDRSREYFKGLTEPHADTQGLAETAYTVGALDQQRIDAYERNLRVEIKESNADAPKFLFSDLLEVLKNATPEQLLQEVRWWGDECGGRLIGLEPLEEDYVHTGGEGMEPRSIALECYKEENNGSADGFDETIESELKAGTLIFTDYTLE
jgi:hypothetical protein